MCTMFNSPWLIIAICLSLSACTDRAVVSGNDADAAADTALPLTPGDMLVTPEPILSDPTDATESDMSTPPTASAPEPASQGTTAESTDAVTPVTPDDLDEVAVETPETSSEATPAGNVETPVAEITGPIDGLLSDPATISDATEDPLVEPVTTGDPGADVNCNLELPCRWLSDDSQFFVTVTNADNIGSLGRLVIEYSVSSLHDTQVNVSSTEPAIDLAGSVYTPSALRLGDAVGGGAQGLLAGESLPATIQFSSAGSAESIDFWSIGLSDSGLIRQPVFSGIPIGSATTEPADCANALPCAWESPANDVTITLLSATGSGTINQLTTSFRVETTRNLTVAVDAGATALGTDGMSYEGRTHSIGVETGAEKLTGDVIAGAQLPGTVFFSRTQSMSEALQTLSLIIYEDDPVPRWNPEFLNVPIQ